MGIKLEPKNQCPFNSFEPCRQLDCALFMELKGTNPNTGESMDQWGCSIAWLPVLFIENTQMQRQTGAAVESFRNEMVQANNNALLMSEMSKRLTNG